MIKIVPDANILLSGMFGISGSIPRQIINLVLARKIVMYGSEETYKEFCRKIKKPKLKRYWDNQIYSLEKLILDYKSIINQISTKGILEEINIVKSDPADDMYFRVAKACLANIIVSGDKHLIKVKKYDNIIVARPREFIDLYKKLY